MQGALIMAVLATVLVLPAQGSAGIDGQQRRCPRGGDACLDRLIADMGRNLDRLGCSHNAAFALLYLRTTESIRDAIRAREFSDRRFWNRVTTAFGRDYLDPLRAWRRGHRRHVPEAWRVAFRAAERERVLTLGDVMLGINAHVNHDLAFIYYRLGVDNHGDHLHVNDVLARVQQTALPEIVARLDPTLGRQTPNDPELSLDIVAWRELAWENAARLAAARTRAARRRVRARIDRHATTMAHQIRRAFPVTTQANRDRDAFCAAHHASSSRWRRVADGLARGRGEVSYSSAARARAA